MKADRWQRIEALYHAADARPRNEWTAFVRDACAGDEALAREVLALLEQPASAGAFFAQSAAGIAAPLLSDDSGLVGRRVGVYQIVSRIGAGGMGEVYRARDTTLNRDVAFKILPEPFALDGDRIARFKREAQILASLNHPNIGAIYGFEDGDGIRGLVLELVDGPTLADRIAQGPVPIDEALPIARQIADALEAAHEQGIVHRDLKPANIKLRPDGTVKVLDFGLAKAVAGPLEGETGAPTITVNRTADGLLLGTVAYMSPEQARGQLVDKRSDIWAFACVVYEMLTGRAAFARETLTETLAAVLEREPEWSAIPDATPSAIVRLLHRCLDKDPKRRLRDIGDARYDCDLLVDKDTVPAMPGRKKTGALAIALAIVGAAVAVGFVPFTLIRSAAGPAPVVTRSAEAAEVRLDVVTPPTSDPVSVAVSPDGSTITFAATRDGATQLWVRRLDSTDLEPLRGTDGASFPFWSPDGRSVAYFAHGALARIDLGSGAVQSLAPADSGRGGAWAPDGTIVFQPSPGVGPLYRVPAQGGSAAATSVTNGRFPQFLPDWRHFIYFRRDVSGSRGVYIADLQGGDGRRVLDTDAAAVFAAPGYLLFSRQGVLFAQAFDSRTFNIRGDPLPVAKGVFVNGPMLNAPVSASRAGPIVYRTASAGGLRQFIWFDRQGRVLGNVGEPTENLLQPELSPDGRRVAVHRLLDANTDIWMLDVDRGILSRVTSSPLAENSPIWSPDGQRLMIASTGNLHVIAPAGGDLKEDVLLETPREKWPNDWSRDGEYVLYGERGTTMTSRHLWALSLGDRKPVPVAQSAADEENGQFSPDARWIAYQSTESGRMEVYVQPFRHPGPKVRVSTGGGVQARWSSDGRELFYIGLDGKLMAVLVTLGANEMQIGVAKPLFATRIGDPLETNMRRAYVVSVDNQRFLIDTLSETTVPMTVLLNWRPPR